MTDEQDAFGAVSELLYGKGRWFRLPKLLHRITLPNGKRLKSAAYTLAAILNQSFMQRRNPAKKGWCTFSGKKAEADTGFPSETQRQHIKTLAVLGIVTSRRAKVCRGYRQLKVDYHRLAELLAQANADAMKLPPEVVALRSLSYPEYLQTDHWQNLRKRALGRAHYRCQLCNTNGTQLDVHHRTYERLGHERLGDLTVLCTDCHAKYHGRSAAAPKGVR